MAKGFSLDFKSFLDYAEELSEQYGNEKLLEATVQALDETRKYVNGEIEQTMASSEYSFDEGSDYSQGSAKKSLEKVKKMPVKVEGTEVTAYAGVSLEDAPEALILAVEGAPHRSADRKLYQAIKVKGKVKKQVQQIQQKVFYEALNGGRR